MSSKDIPKEIYAQKLILSRAAGLNLVSHKLLKTSWGVPMSTKTLFMMAIALGVSSVIVKKLQEIYDVLDNPFERSL